MKDFVGFIRRLPLAFAKNAVLLRSRPEWRFAEGPNLQLAVDVFVLIKHEIPRANVNSNV